MRALSEVTNITDQSAGFKPSLTSLDQLMQRTRRRREPRDKEVEGEGVREEEEASMAPASFSLRKESIDVHFLYVSLIFI